MKVIKFSPDLSKKLEQIKLRDLKLFTRIQRKLELFQSDPKHPSLRLHKVTREVKNAWSISINKSIRILYTDLEEDLFSEGKQSHGLYFFEIGTHDEVYRKK